MSPCFIKYIDNMNNDHYALKPYLKTINMKNISVTVILS